MKIRKDKESTITDWYEEGRRLRREGHLGKAIQALNLAIDHKIKFGGSYFERGLCHYRLGNYRQAEFDLEAAALLGCKDAQLWSKYDRKRSQKLNADKKR